MDRSQEQIHSAQEIKFEPVNAAPGVKIRLTKPISCIPRHVPVDPSNRLDRSPATPLMVTPTAAWRRLCARTGCGVTLQSFYRWIRNGSVHSVRLGGRIFVPLEGVNEIIRRCLAGDPF